MLRDTAATVGAEEGLFSKRSEILRAVVSITIENPTLAQKIRFSYFTNETLCKLFSKTVFKSFIEVQFSRKMGKFKIGLNLAESPMDILQIRTF